MVDDPGSSMTASFNQYVEQLDRDGYGLVEGIFSVAEVEAMIDGLEAALAPGASDAASTRSRSGAVYAARNVLSLWPQVADAWRREPLPRILKEILGERFGLVRVLYFDKPPERTWTLPWHKDMTIAVKDNRLPSGRFLKPTVKAGVPHVEAPVELLERMLTARIHLDAVTDENGALKVVPGSHRSGKALKVDGAPAESIHAARGDVLLMRPLLAHSSGRSREGTTKSRRILHLEFAPSPELDDGFRWQDFIPGHAGHTGLLR